MEMDYGVFRAVPRPDGLHIASLAKESGETGAILPRGGTLEATVLFASRTNANVLLQNGALVRARLDDGVVLREGDTVLLTVLHNDGESILLEVSSPEKEIPIAFAALGVSLPVTAPEEDMNMLLNALSEDSLSPVAALLEQAETVRSRYPFLSLPAAAFSAANEIPLSPESARILDALSRSDYKVGASLLRLIGLMRQSVEDAPGGFALAEKASSEQPELSVEPAVPRSSSAETPVPLEGKEGFSRFPGPVSDKDGGTDAPGDLLTALKQALMDFERSDGGSPAPAGPEKASVIPASAAKILSGEDSRAGSGRSDGEAHLFLSPPEGGLRGDGGRSPVRAGEELFFARAEVPEALKRAGEELSGRLLRMISQEEIKVPGNGEFFREAAGLLEAQSLFRSVRLFTYLQIPIMINAYRATAELYVFRKRKGLKKENPKETSLLLVLDTQRLGRVEVLVRVRESGISFRFTLRDTAAAQAMKERTERLYRLVSPLGFKYSGAVFLSDAKPVTPVNAIRELADTGNGWHGKISIRA